MINNLDNLENNFGKKKELEGIEITSNWKEVLTSKIPYGTIVEFYGESSSGKSTAILDLISKIDTEILYFDTEFSFDINYAKIFGLNLNKVVISKTNEPLISLDILNTILERYYFKIVVIDSLTAFNVNNIESLENVLQNIKKELKKYRTILLVTNQVRNNFKTYRKQSLGTKKMKDLYDIRIKVDEIKDGLIYLTIKKNKFINRINKEIDLRLR